jgi:ribosomal protein S12 methylthiotransferase accessory factor
MSSLARAHAAATSCGVTRLADVTRLDDLGVAVFQAVRPWSRGLSAHQGKALSAREARIGALMEAVESDHAETYAGERRTGAFETLPPPERAPSLGDFCSERALAPSVCEPLAWTPAARIGDGRRLWVPFDVVSLDFTRRGDTRLDRSSNGLGAGWDLPSAIRAALLEIVERDAVHVWRASTIEDRSLDRVAAGSIAYPWFQALAGRIRRAGLTLAIYWIAAVIPLPVLVAELVERDCDGGTRRRSIGSACRASPEEALLRSVVEAAQSRLTAISGVRDDILHAGPLDRSDGELGLGLPLPPHIRATPWDAILSRFPARPEPSPAGLASLLTSAGFPDASFVDLSRPCGGVTVVKAVAPGLAAFSRERRPASVRP